MPDLCSLLRRLQHPAAIARALGLRAKMYFLILRNRFSRSAVATGTPGPVVSLTTYGKRAHAVYLAIESIARGSTRPSRLILWIDDAAFYANPPRPLRRLMRRGLELQPCKNYGPHKKYYGFVENQEHFTAPLITADDDVIYSRSWLAALIAAHAAAPHTVSCYRARVMTLHSGTIAPYREWPLCHSTEPSFHTVATGVSGVLYPAALLDRIRAAGTAFETRCPKADDLWLHVQAIRAGFPIRQIQVEPIHFPVIPGSQESSLYAQNCAEGDGNDRQLALTYEPSDLDLLRTETTRLSGYQLHRDS